MRKEPQFKSTECEPMKIHETQETVKTYTAKVNGDTHEIEAMQRITGMGTPKKVHLSDLPKPIRIFAYFFFGSVVVMFIFALLINWIK